MAESFKQILMDVLSKKDSPADTDNFLFGEGNILKKISFTKLCEAVKNKFSADNQKVLWSGTEVMDETTTITLSEAISEQLNGVVLVFSAFDDGDAKRYEFTSHFVSKTWAIRHAGGRCIFLMSSQTLGYFGVKSLYIKDKAITGTDANNTDTKTTNSGIKSTNNRYVLRYVIGV